MTSSLDPIQLSILNQALRSITEEMGANLVRSSFSTVIREARDCSTAILTPDGEVVAQSALIPMQTVALSEAFHGASQRVDLGRLTDGHAMLMNDPYAGGQHLNDLILFQPVLFDGALLGYVGSTAHHIDIGGADAGINVRATHLLQEGIVISPMIFNIRNDWEHGNLESLICANVRLPDILRGDLNAQFAANHIGIERLSALARREGPDTVRQAMDAILDHGETRMRQALARIPDGVYHGSARMDRDVFDPIPIEVKVKVTVSGSDIELDYAGTHAQVASMFNCPPASSRAAALSAIRCLVSDQKLPSNDGCNRPIVSRFPEGSILNPHWPAPVRARAIVAYRAFDAILVALAGAMPEQATAPGFNTTTAVYISQQRQDGSTRIYGDIFGGGLGAGQGYDGADAVDAIMSNCRCTPIEVIEHAHDHLRVASFAIEPDSGGAGQWRGGLGFQRTFDILEDGADVSIYSDRFRFAAQGLHGGTPGGLGALEVLRDGEKIRLDAMSTFPLKRGDRLTIRVGGGGGWGDPARRASEAIQTDLVDGWVTHPPGVSA
ncbi:MAG TPA: hydantoinase B/oxoprolinase family protein [Bordetella sp.]